TRSKHLRPGAFSPAYPRRVTPSSRPRNVTFKLPPPGTAIAVSHARLTQVVNADLTRNLVAGPGASPGVFSPDGRFFFAESSGTVFSTERSIGYRQEHAGQVAFLQDGRYRASANNGKIRVEDRQTGTQSTQVISTGDVSSLAVSQDGARIAATKSSGDVIVWDRVSGTLLHTWTDAASTSPHALAFFAAGTRLATASTDGHVRIWSVDSGELQRELRHEGTGPQPHTLRVNVSGTRIASAYDGQCRVWDLTSGELERQLISSSSSLAFLPNAGLLIDDRAVFLESGHVQWQADQIDAQHAVISSDGARVWMSDRHGGIQLLDRDTGVVFLEFTLGEPVTSLAFDPLTHELVAAGALTSRVWGGIPGFRQAELRSGRPLDLLSFIDPEAESTVGSWSVTDGGLVGGQEHHARVSIGVAPVGDYRLSFTLRRDWGIDSANVHLPVGGRRAHLVIGGFPGAGYYSQIRGTGRKSASGFRLEKGKSHRVELLVESSDGQAQISSTVDGAPLVNWEGALASLSAQIVIPEEGAIAIGCYDGRVVYRDVTLEMASGTARLLDQKSRLLPTDARKVQREGPVNVLPLANTLEDELAGDWEHGSVQLLASGPDCRRMLPVIPIGPYQFDVEFTRDEANRSVGFILPVGSGSVMLTLRADQFQLETMPATTGAHPLPHSLRHHLRAEIHLFEQEARIVAQLNGATLVQWVGGQQSLGLAPKWHQLTPGSLGLAAFNGRISFHRLEITALDGELYLLRNLKPGLPVGWELLSTEEAIDLMPHLDLARLYNAEAEQTVDGLRHHHEPGTASGRIPIMLMPQGSYELTASFTRTEGESAVSILLPVGDERVSLTLGRQEKEASGLALINRAGTGDPGHPATVQPHHLNNDHRYELQVTVELAGDDTKIGIRMDGEPFLRWQGPQTALGVSTAWDIPDRAVLGLGLQRGTVIWHGHMARA
ncbi:MAG: WD40 repeat protein, partial [Rhodothermales bacterium]